MAVNVKKTEILIVGKDRSKEAFRSTRANMRKTASVSERMSASVRKNWRGIGVAVAAVGVVIRKTIQDAAKFQTAVNDMAKVTSRDLRLVSDEVRSLSSELGDSTQLMQGYYQVISAGVTDPVKALELLVTASKAANAAHVDQAEVIKGLTKLMAGYEGEIENVTEASDLLFTIEKAGQTSFQELIPVIGGLAKISKEANISSREMGAALSVILKTAGSTAEATTRYRATVVALIKPTEEMTGVFKQMGFSSFEAAVKQKGFREALDEVRKTGNAMGISMSKLFGRVEGLIGQSALAANSFKDFDAIAEEFNDTLGKTDKAFNLYLQTFEGAWQTFTNEIKNLSITIGTFLLPTMTKLVKESTDLISGLAGSKKELADLNAEIFRLEKSMAANDQQQSGLIMNWLYPKRDKAEMTEASSKLDELKRKRDELLGTGTGGGATDADAQARADARKALEEEEAQARIDAKALADQVELDREAEKQAKLLEQKVEARQREIDQLDAMWVAQTLTESERLDLWYLQQQEKAAGSWQMMIQLQEIYLAKKKKLDEKEKKELTERQKFEAMSFQKQTKFVSGQLEAITAAGAKENKAFFLINKLAAGANAIVNTSEGVTAALKLGPIGIPLAGIIAAAGAIEIANIAGTSFSGGGGGGGSVPAAEFLSPSLPSIPEPTDLVEAPEATNRGHLTINIHNEGNLVDMSNVMDDIGAHFSEWVGDGIIDLNVT